MLNQTKETTKIEKKSAENKKKTIELIVLFLSALSEKSIKSMRQNGHRI